MWGSAGSVFDVGEFEHAEDRHGFWRLLVQLAGAMKAQLAIGIDIGRGQKLRFSRNGLDLPPKTPASIAEVTA